MKELVYYVIGCHKDYSKLLDFSLHTLRLSGNCMDVMVMCDEDYYQHIKDFPVTHFHITPKNTTPVQSSMRKVEIFNFEHIHRYDKVLYLDCDIVINDDLSPIFHAMTRDDVLYVVRNEYGMYTHTHQYYSCSDDPHDEETLRNLAEKEMYGFNAGQFGFCVSDKMMCHFAEVQKSALRFDPKIHFYEQSFMNTYFNRIFAVDYTMETFVYLHGFETDPLKKVILYHVCGTVIPYLEKLQKMESIFKEMSSRKILVRETRDDIGTIVKLPRDPHIAEIGVFRGEFSSILYNTYSPGRLYLIDPWEGTLVSGDKNGNNVVHISSEVALREVQDRFGNASNVTIYRTYSKDIGSKEIPDGSLDLIYIDGDHTYEGAYADLHLAWRLVKPGGWIAGHDYSINRTKAMTNYEFGVRRAVDQFCKEKELAIHAIMEDGCVSFVLQKSRS